LLSAEFSSAGFTSSCAGSAAFSEGFPFSSEGLPSSSEGLTSSSDGFVASSEGLPSSSEGFTSSDGFPSSSDGFPSTSDVPSTFSEVVCLLAVLSNVSTAVVSFGFPSLFSGSEYFSTASSPMGPSRSLAGLPAESRKLEIRISTKVF
jgi:hypothetical protein